MAKEKTPLKFDQREITVIFALFVFVTLLMFTVGILVGKGLTTAKYEGKLNLQSIQSSLAPSHFSEPTTHEPEAHAPTGTSVSTDDPHAAHGEEHAKTDDTHHEGEEHAEQKAPEDEPLDLVPKKANDPNVFSGSYQEMNPAIVKKTNKILKDPKISKLLEGGSGSGHVAHESAPAHAKKKSHASNDWQKRKPAAVSKPESFEQGKYTVQVGSYPNEADATARVEQLKNLGFKHAYFSAKELADRQEVWYRVWLGYFPSFNSAEQNAKFLQERGEVRNYLVRKATDSQG